MKQLTLLLTLVFLPVLSLSITQVADGKEYIVESI